MVKIFNKTKNVVTVYNDNFSVNIDVNASVEISEDVINKNNEFYVRYLSLKQAKNKTEFELKRRKFSYRKYFHYELKTLFPLITVLNLKDVSVVVNKESFVKTYGTKMPESVKEFYLIFSHFRVNTSDILLVKNFIFWRMRAFRVHRMTEIKA